MPFDQTGWLVQARIREELEDAFDSLLALPDAALPTFVEVRLSPAAAEEIDAWIRSELGDEYGLGLSFPRSEELVERGYCGWFDDDPRVGSNPELADAGEFFLELEDLFRGPSSAVDWGCWVLRNAGIPATYSVHMYEFAVVPRRLLEHAREVIVRDAEWSRHADDITFVER